MVRYIDVDEFAHLHWAANIARGQVPYKDFVTFFPPGFHLLLMPLLKAGWGTTAPILWGRMLAFGVFVGLVGAIVGLFWQLRRSPIAILAGVFLAFLPLPFDKFLELRPDTLATLMALLGMILEIQWMRAGKKYLAFCSGLFYALALLVLTKVAPQGAVATLFVLVWGWRSRHWEGVHMFFAGVTIPLLVFLVWAFLFADIGTVLYSLFLLPIEANRLANQFYMGPDLFFYPNAIFYGVGGWSRGLLANHVIWVAGICIGAYRLVTPLLATKDHNSRPGSVWAELFVAMTFFVQILSFMYGFPLRHSQYLIPIAVFISFYAADGVYVLWQNIRGLWTRAVALGLYIIMLLFLYTLCVEVNQPKLAWTNREDIKSVKHAIAVIPKDAFVLDLVGQTLFFRDPYPVCCTPFGQWAGYLSRPLPSLSGALVQTKTYYIYDGAGGRINTLPAADQEFIRRYFGPPVDGLRIAQ